MKNIIKILAVAALLCVSMGIPSACASTGAAVSGKTVTFYLVSCDGTTPFTFQWQKNGTAISGATGVAVPSYVTGISVPLSAYIISTVVSTDAGVYTVVVTNAAGSATSDTATLTIITGPGNIVTGVKITQNGVTRLYPIS
jgi:hypothetical protein